MNTIFDYLSGRCNGKNIVPEVIKSDLKIFIGSKPNAQEAKNKYKEICTIIGDFEQDEEFSIDCCHLFEKTKEGDRLALWTIASQIYSANIVAVRLVMRWYYRLQDIESGVVVLVQLTADKENNPNKALMALLGYSELKLYDEIDAFMKQCLEKHPRNKALRNRYVISLAEQHRYEEALEISQYFDRESYSKAMNVKIKAIEEKINSVDRPHPIEPDALAKIATLFKTRDCNTQFRDKKNVALFTGQLGSGGAERQLSRIAVHLREKHDIDNTSWNPLVIVRHAKPELKSDFFLPQLIEAKVPVIQLNDEPLVNVSDITDCKIITGLLQRTNQQLRESILTLTSKLISREINTLYVWQDGAVLIGVVAALLAGTPNIICSFRGMPPSMRPELMRAEIPFLYKVIPQIPGVSFSANSRVAANSYCDWLRLSHDRFVIIPNSVIDFVGQVNLQKQDKDIAQWSDIYNSSIHCTQTVVGIFRFDDNKRPIQWIEIAAEYIKSHDHTRFIIVGRGKLFETCELKIKELGMEERIFLTGASKNVPFWLEKADLLMHLARLEGLPNAVIEAQISSTPVIATPAGGTIEIVEHGQTGFVVDNAETLNKTEVLEDLKKILENKVLMKKMSKKAREVSLKRHNPSVILELTEQLFDKGIMTV